MLLSKMKKKKCTEGGGARELKRGEKKGGVGGEKKDVRVVEGD